MRWDSFPRAISGEESVILSFEIFPWSPNIAQWDSLSWHSPQGMESANESGLVGHDTYKGMGEYEEKVLEQACGQTKVDVENYVEYLLEKTLGLSDKYLQVDKSQAFQLDTSACNQSVEEKSDANRVN